MSSETTNNSPVSSNGISVKDIGDAMKDGAKLLEHMLPILASSGRSKKIKEIETHLERVKALL